jgi:hypothetical protein
MAIDESGWIYALTRAGLFRSEDGGYNWSSMTFGLPGKSLPKEIYAHPSGILYAAMAGPEGHRLYSSFDGGESWGATPLSGELYSLATLGDQFAIARTSEGAFRTFDNWLSMEPLSTNVRDFQTGEDGKLYALRGDQLVSSSDQGASWDLMNPFTSTPCLEAVLQLREVFVSPEGHLFASAGYSGCTGISAAGIYRSTTGGDSWTLLMENVFPYNIFMDEFGRLYANPEGEMVSYNNGDNWSSLDDGLLFADEYGINGILDPAIPALAITDDGTLYAGSRGFGLFSGDAGTLTHARDIQQRQENGLTLYPNPAVSFVQVSIDNTWRGDLRLQLVNLQGQVVGEQQLHKPDGPLEFRYMLPNVPTGQYWLRLLHKNGHTAAPLLIR